MLFILFSVKRKLIHRESSMYLSLILMRHSSTDFTTGSLTQFSIFSLKNCALCEKFAFHLHAFVTEMISRKLSDLIYEFSNFSVFKNVLFISKSKTTFLFFFLHHYQSQTGSLCSSRQQKIGSRKLFFA